MHMENMNLFVDYQSKWIDFSCLSIIKNLLILKILIVRLYQLDSSKEWVEKIKKRK